MLFRSGAGLGVAAFSGGWVCKTNQMDGGGRYGRQTAQTQITCCGVIWGSGLCFAPARGACGDRVMKAYRAVLWLHHRQAGQASRQRTWACWLAGLPVGTAALGKGLAAIDAVGILGGEQTLCQPGVHLLDGLTILVAWATQIVAERMLTAVNQFARFVRNRDRLLLIHITTCLSSLYVCVPGPPAPPTMKRWGRPPNVALLQRANTCDEEASSKRSHLCACSM